MSPFGTSPLLPTLKQAGGVTADYHGGKLVRHFGDPSAEYEAATGGVAVFDRSHRARFTVRGRAPGQMLKGIVTGRIPMPPDFADGVGSGRATYHAVLTPKGKMITDLWMISLGAEDEAGYLLDVPVAGAEPLRAALAKLLPPRLAVLEDVSERTGMITLVGPRAGAVASRVALGQRVDPEGLLGLDEGAWRTVSSDAATGLLVERTAEVWPDALTVVGPVDEVGACWRAAVDAGATPGGLGVWSTLRVEAGRPVFGTDMTADTIPIEAGIGDRAIDHTKGCYTGQEVIVRIRDRGHVNRSLRLLELGEAPTPPSGTELMTVDDPAKSVGWITSAVQSPRRGGVIALAYVRHGVDKVLLDGAEVAVPA